MPLITLWNNAWNENLQTTRRNMRYDYKKIENKRYSSLLTNMELLLSAENSQLTRDTFKLLQPELLTIDELVYILKERGVAPNSLPQTKDNLVSLFKRVAVPLPQRELRHNYRGTLLMKIRKKIERDISNDSSAGTSYTLGVRESEKGILLGGPEQTERLKPPPSTVNFERRKIQLNSKSSVTTKHKTDSELDKIVIKKHKKSENNLINIEKIITKSEAPSKDVVEANRSEVAPKKVSLKRNRFNSENSSDTLESTAAAAKEQPLDPDKKHKPITWP